MASSGGGSPEEFADFYNATGIAIPWSNQNAEYQDGPHHVTVRSTKKAYVDADEIQTDPNYGIENIRVEKIQTRGVDTSTAIHNIKHSLNNDKPVILSLTFPNEETLDQFVEVWYHQTESDPLDISSWSQEEINYTEKGAHEMLVVGYEGDDWIVLNRLAGWSMAGHKARWHSVPAIHRSSPQSPAAEDGPGLFDGVATGQSLH